MIAGTSTQSGRSSHHLAFPLRSRPNPSGHRSMIATRYAVMCQRKSVMMMLLAKMTVFHARTRWSHRVSRSRSSIAAPIVQMPTAMNTSVGGNAFEIGPTSVPSVLFG